MFFRRLFWIFLISIFVSCVGEQNDVFTADVMTTSYAEPQGIEIWIDSVRQDIKILRLRKANGAGRMRFLVELADSLHLSLFVTPFDIGYFPIHSSIVEDDEIKFSRTHLELKKQINAHQYIYYETDTMSVKNHVIISHIDTVEQTVSGIFQCQMKMLSPASEPIKNQLQIRGKFHTTYRD
jgi:hypothetical protein